MKDGRAYPDVGSCELSIWDHAPMSEVGDDALIQCADPDHQAALRRRGDRGALWGEIVRGDDGGGFRDFLDGKPIHCGSGLELQAIDYRSDDYGEWIVYLPTGTRVRYEVAWGPPRDTVRHHIGTGKTGIPFADRVPVLHGRISGYEFTSPIATGMRFRWPPEKR